MNLSCASEASFLFLYVGNFSPEYHPVGKRRGSVRASRPAVLRSNLTAFLNRTRTYIFHNFSVFNTGGASLLIHLKDFKRVSEHQTIRDVSFGVILLISSLFRT